MSAEKPKLCLFVGCGMTGLEARHMQLVDRVNNSKTWLEYSECYIRLCGFQEGVEACGNDLYELLTHADEAQRNRGVTRPMRGGVWLDWKPPADADNSNDTEGVSRCDTS